MDQKNSSMFVIMIIAFVGLGLNITVDSNLDDVNAYASSQDSNGIDLIQQISLIALSVQNLSNDSYSQGYLDGLQSQSPSSQQSQSSVFGLCINESGLQVEGNIGIDAVVENGVLKISGSGINYDREFDNHAIISLFPINDYDGTKDIHLVKVKPNGDFFGFFDTSKVFYDGYDYNGNYYNGNIDSLGNYKIEIQYDLQCGFTDLSYQ